MRPFSGMVLTAALGLSVWAVAQEAVYNPHGDPQSGALRVLTQPSTRGECSQCHLAHGEEPGGEAFPGELFTENTNNLCFFPDGAGPCHSTRPVNYPLGEDDRLPPPGPETGYPEAVTGTERRVGVEYRGRWPGAFVFNNPGFTTGGHAYSPHAQDPDMPRRDAGGQGLCLNCHDPHGTPNPHDLLTGSYHGIAGHGTSGPPAAYGHCFDCHGQNGPLGMDEANRLIADFYDSGLNGDRAGHQIRRNPAIALSWPAHVLPGDKLPCYDCHNPHGSEGANRVQPNAYALSDQRPGWSGLTDPATDPGQNRRFCLGCHIPSDGIAGSQSVEGIVMNTLPSSAPEHAQDGTTGCNQCHGRDYSSPTGRNVHSPGRGDEPAGFDDGWERKPWR